MDNSTMNTATITAAAEGRYAVTIGPVTRDGFALTWFAQGRADLRLIDGVVAETVSIAVDTPTRTEGSPLAFPPSEPVTILDITHPDRWSAPEPTEASEAEVQPVITGPTTAKPAGRTKTSTAPAPAATEDAG